MLADTHYLATSKSADALIFAGKGYLGGFLVTASNSGVIRFWDSATSPSGSVLIDQLGVVSGAFLQPRIEVTKGLYFDLVSGTATVTVLYLPS